MELAEETERSSDAFQPTIRTMTAAKDMHTRYGFDKLRQRQVEVTLVAEADLTHARSVGTKNLQQHTGRDTRSVLLKAHRQLQRHGGVAGAAHGGEEKSVAQSRAGASS